MKDKTAIITGANVGVGFATAVALARTGAHVVLVCRNRERGEQAKDRISKKVPGASLQAASAEFRSLSTVRALGMELAAKYPKVDILVNNAGVYRQRREITEDGFEHTFAVNHLSHFLLTHLLAASLTRTHGRVITVGSEAHRGAKLTRAPLEKIIRGEVRYRGFLAYSDSKLANHLFTAELTRRHPAHELAAVTLHPGVLATRIWNRNLDPASLFMRLIKPLLGRPSVGGNAVAFLAYESPERIHGAYYEKQKRSTPAQSAADPALARELWDISSRLVGIGASKRDDVGAGN